LEEDECQSYQLGGPTCKQSRANPAPAGMLTSVITTKSSSVSSSITGGTGVTRSGTKHSSVALHQDIIVLASDSHKSPIPIAIHSPMAHIMLHMGLTSKEKDYPALKCVFDSRAVLSTASFHFMEAVICQFPHILKKIYLPDNYVAIILSSIVNTPNSAPVTAKINVGLTSTFLILPRMAATPLSLSQQALMLLLILSLFSHSSRQHVLLLSQQCL
jgi:hypothetical protein